MKRKYRKLRRRVGKLRRSIKELEGVISDLSSRVAALEHGWTATTPAEMQHELDTDALWRAAVADYAAGEWWDEEDDDSGWQAGPYGYL